MELAVADRSASVSGWGSAVCVAFMSCGLEIDRSTAICQPNTIHRPHSAYYNKVKLQHRHLCNASDVVEAYTEAYIQHLSTWACMKCSIVTLVILPAWNAVAQTHKNAEPASM